MKLRLPLLLLSAVVSLYSSVATATDYYRTIGSGTTEDWTLVNAWKTGSPGGTPATWDAAVADGVARVTAGAELSTLTIGSGTMTAAGFHLLGGKLAVSGAGTLKLLEDAAIAVDNGAGLTLSRIAFANSSKKTLNITLGDQSSLTLGSSDSRLGTSTYTWNVSGGENSSIYLYLDKSTGAGNYLDFGTATTLKHVYVDGTLSLNVSNTGGSTDIVTKIGSAALHLANGSQIFVNNNNGNANGTKFITFANDIYLGESVVFRANGYGFVHFTGNVKYEAGSTGANITTDNYGQFHFYGDVDLGTGTFSAPGSTSQVRVHFADKSKATMGELNINVAAVVFKNESSLTADKVVMKNSNGNLTVQDKAAFRIGELNVQFGTFNLNNTATLTVNDMKLEAGVTNLQNDSVAEVKSVVMGNKSGSSATLNIKDKTRLTLTGGADSGFSFVVGSVANGTGIVNMSGGTLAMGGLTLKMIDSGKATFTLTGGEMTVQGIDFTGGRDGAPAPTGAQADFYLGAASGGAGTGEINIGAEGIKGLVKQGDYAPSLNLGQGTIKAAADWGTNTGGDVTIHMTSTAGTVFDPNGHTITINHDLDGAGKLILDGTGTLILKGVNSTHAETIVRQGSLQLASDKSSGTNLTLYRRDSGTNVSVTSGTYTVGAARALSVMGNAGQASMTGNLVFDGGSFLLDVNALTAANNTTAYFSTSGSISFLQKSVFDVIGDGLGGIALNVGDKFLLAEASGGITGYTGKEFLSYYPISELAAQFRYQVSADGNKLYLTITSAGETLVWNTASGGIWNTVSTNKPWKTENSGTASAFATGSRVSFVDMAGNGTVGVSLEGSVNAAKIDFDNTGTNYVLSGSGALSGSALLTKTGTGTVTMDVSNTDYTGIIDLKAGTFIGTKTDSLGAGNILFNGGTLGLNIDLAEGVAQTVSLATVGGDSKAQFLVDTGKGAVIAHNDAMASLYSKDISLAGNGSLSMGGSGATFGGNVTVSGNGSLTLTGTNFNVGLLSNKQGGMLTVNMTANGTIGKFEGILTKSGTATAIITGASFNASSGSQLIVEQGAIRATGTTDATTQIDIILKTGTTLEYGNGSNSGAEAAKFLANGTLTMGDNTALKVDSTSGGGDFNMNIVLNGGEGTTAYIRGLQGSAVVFTKAITGTGNLTLEKFNQSYNSSYFAFKDGWLASSYVGNTLQTSVGTTFELSNAAAFTDGMTLTPWGASSNKFTLGGRTNDYDNRVTFRGSAPQGEASILEGKSYVIANDITFNSQASAKGAYISLFTDSSNSGKLTGAIHATGKGSANMAGSSSLELAGSLTGDKDLNIGMRSASAATNKVIISGNASAYAQTLNITNSNLVLNSSAAANKTFGGSFNMNGGSVYLGSAGQTISGNLNMILTPAEGAPTSGTFVFDTSLMQSGGGFMLGIGGNLAMGAGNAITLDNTSLSLEDGTYNLLALTGTLTGSFDLDTINWINNDQPGAGSFILTWLDNKLVLTVSGLSSQEWYGTNATGNGTWSESTAGWGPNGTSNYIKGSAVSFGDIPGVTASQVTIAGDVSPSSIKVSQTSGKTTTFDGAGRIVDNTTAPTSLTKQGAGELILAQTAANTYSGGTFIKEGTLTLRADGALGSGAVTLTGGTLQLDKAGSALLGTGNTLLFNGGTIAYTANADQDISTLIGVASSSEAKVSIAAFKNITWSKALDAINVAITKSGTGTLQASVANTLGKKITVNAGTLSLNVSTVTLNMDMLAGASSSTLYLGNARGAVGAVTLSGTTTFTGALGITGTSATDTAKGFDLGTMSHLNSVRQLVLSNVALTTAAGASFTKAVGLTGAVSFNGGSSTLSGDLAGSSGLTLTNTTMTLTGDVSGYTGVITNNATLNFGNNTAAILDEGNFLGSSSLVGTGTYAVNYSNATSLKAIVGGSANLTQSGSGVLSLGSANTSTGTLTIDANRTVDLAQGGSWAGAITGAGTLQVSSNASLDLSKLSGATALKQTGTGTITLNHGTPSGYTGDITIAGGGTLDLQKAYSNKITMNKGSLTGGSNASNIYIEATGDVNLGGASGGSIKSLNSTQAGALISGITGSLTLASSSLQVGVNNLSTTTGSDGTMTGTPIVSFTDGTTASLTVTGTLTLKVNATALEAFLTGNRDLYLIGVTNGTLNAGTVDFDNYLTGLGYRYEGIVGGSVQINGKAVESPYLVGIGEERTITNPSELDVYPSVVNQGTWNIDIAPGQTIIVKELEGRVAEAMINTGKEGSTVELSNDNDNFTSGTSYDGSIRGAASLVKSGQYDLSVGGSVQTGGNLSVEEGQLSIGGSTTVAGITTIGDGAALNLGGNLSTGALDLSPGQSLTLNGHAITLTGQGLTTTLGDNSAIAGLGGITLSNGTSLEIGSNVNLNGAGINWGEGSTLATGTDITLNRLNGSGDITLDNATVTLGGQGDWKGALLGSAGSLVKNDGQAQTIRSMGNDQINVLVQNGTLTLARDNNVTSTDRIAYNDLSVGSMARGASVAELILADTMYADDLTVYSNGTLSLGGNRPTLDAAPVTLSVAGASFMSGSTLNMIIPNDAGSIVASGAITLPTSMTLNLLNNGTFSFESPPKDLVLMKADGGYVWGDGSQAGQTIANGTVFNHWTVAIEKSISLFYGSADVYLDADSKTLKATPIASGRNTLLDVAQSANATAGANMLWAAGLQPTNSTLDALLSSIMDDVKAGNNAAASRKMAASVGSTYVSMLSAQQAGLRYQQTLIRNRMTGMGLNQGYQYNDLPYFNAWIQANGSYDKLDSRGDEAGFDLNTWGGTAGFDMNITPRLTAGTAFSASYGDLNSDAADSMQGDLDMYYVNLFAQYKHRNWTHALILTGAWGEADVNRTVNFGSGLYRGKGKTDASSYGAMYELSYDIAMNENKTTILQPLFNASIQKNKMDGFSETGAGNAGLNVNGLDSTTGSLSAGARLLGLVGSNVFGREAVGEVRAQLVQDVGDSRATGDVSYQANPGFMQRIRGAKVGSTGVQFGVGLTVPVGQEGSIFAEGNVDLRSHATSANGSIGYRYNF